MKLSELRDRIKLTPIVDADDAAQGAILSIRNQDEVRRNMYTDQIITPTDHAGWLSRLKTDSGTKFFVVTVDGEVVGGVSLNAINRLHRRADWAFYLDAGMQGRGLGSALEFAFLDRAFFDEGLLKLNCEVIAFNEAVVKLHTKFGFHHEGARRAHVLRDGQAHDAILLGITKAEWEERRGELLKGAFR